MAAPTDSIEISALTAGAALDGTEIVPMVQAGATVRNPLSAALTYFNANASLAAARITSGQLALARGGTGADLSATGGANQVVRQNSAGGVFTVSALAAADIPNLDAGKITTGTLAVARGGTGIASYTIGDLIYASGATTLAALADVATGNVLLSGGVGVAPAWGKVDVTAHITGIVPSANGGTGVNNAGTLTNASNTTITGGGTLALAGFTLTVPATGTASLLGTAQTITAVKTLTITDAATNTTTVPLILGHNSSGTTAASFGVGLKMTLDSSTTDDQDAAQIEAIWTTATHASRTSALIFSTVLSAASLAERMRIDSNGVTVTSAASQAQPLRVVNSAAAEILRVPHSGNNSYVGMANAAITGIASAASFQSSGDVQSPQFIGTIIGTTSAAAYPLIIQNNPSGTPGAGMQTIQLLRQKSSTTNNRDVAQIVHEWATSTDASRKGRLTLHAFDSSAAREVIRIESDGSAGLLGLFGVNAVAKQTSGANLTNNVTSGGTDDTIANFTDLTVYATDAATIRNDIYQLARKLKQVNDALRLYGLLT